MPLPTKAPPSWASREAEPQQHQRPPRNTGNRTWPSIPPVLCNVAPLLHTSHRTPGLATGVPSMSPPLHRGCCRAGTEPLKHWDSCRRKGLQHGNMSLCGAPGGFTPPQLWCWCGLLLCCEMGSCNMRPVLPRKRQFGSRAGKTLRCQALPFQQH